MDVGGSSRCIVRRVHLQQIRSHETWVETFEIVLVAMNCDHKLLLCPASIVNQCLPAGGPLGRGASAGAAIVSEELWDTTHRRLAASAAAYGSGTKGRRPASPRGPC